MLNEDHTQIDTVYRSVFRGAHSASWSMVTVLEQLGREADNSTVVKRLRMHEAFPPHVRMTS